MPNIGLEDRKIDDARRVVDSLLEAGFHVEAAFWAFLESIGEWRLVIASSDLSKIGPDPLIERVYDQVEGMNGKSSFELFDVDIRGASDPDVVEFFLENPFSSEGVTLKNVSVQRADGSVLGINHVKMIRDRTESLPWRKGP